MEAGADVGARPEHPGAAPDVARGVVTATAGEIGRREGRRLARSAERNQAGTRRGVAAAAEGSAEEQPALRPLAARRDRGAAEGRSGDTADGRPEDIAAVG